MKIHIEVTEPQSKDVKLKILIEPHSQMGQLTDRLIRLLEKIIETIDKEK